MNTLPKSRSTEQGFSLIDAIVGIFGLSIILVSVLSAIYVSYNTTRDTASRDQMVQIARSVMEDMKTKLINYHSGDELSINYTDTNDSLKSSLCGTSGIYSCIAFSSISNKFATISPTIINTNQTDNVLNLKELANVQRESSNSCGTTPISVGYPEYLGIQMKNGALSYQVKIEAVMPNNKVTTSGGVDLYLCKYTRKFIITVSPQIGSRQSPYKVEAYIPLPS